MFGSFSCWCDIHIWAYIMTDNERVNKVYLARLKYGRKFIHELPLPKHDISVGRKTPKSEFLKSLEQRCAEFKGLIKPIIFFAVDPANDKPFLDAWQYMISVYTGSDLNHFRDSEFLNSESIPTYKSSK